MCIRDRKTAALLAGSLKIGGLIGGANEEDANHLYEFGRNIGIAFQLQDDILDTFGDPEKFGKRVGGDIVQNKKTFLVIKALEVGNEEKRAELNKLMNTTPQDEEQKIETVRSIFNELQVREKSEALMETYLNKAFESLDKIKVDESRKEPLRNLSNQLMGREV